MIVQIYEIQTETEAETVLGLGVDHVGSVVLSETDWKKKEIRSVINLTRSAGKKSALIPLFDDITAINRCLEYYQPDIVHFCDSIEIDAFEKDAVDRLVQIQTAVRQRFPEIKIMRSIPIREPDKMSHEKVLKIAGELEPYSDFFLTDTVLDPAAGEKSAAAQPVSGFVGITGRICDWNVASKLVVQSRIPVILAGGLGPANVMEGILKVRPFGVDSCSATNAQDADGKTIRFRKDPEKVSRFVDAAHTAARLIPARQSG